MWQSQYLLASLDPATPHPMPCHPIPSHHISSHATPSAVRGHPVSFATSPPTPYQITSHPIPSDGMPCYTSTSPAAFILTPPHLIPTYPTPTHNPLLLQLLPTHPSPQPTPSCSSCYHPTHLQVLSQSNLPLEELSHIWELADVDLDGAFPSHSTTTYHPTHS